MIKTQETDIIFTIAIPTYNNEKTISNAIESALFQNYAYNYEILIVNNASTDNTLNVIKQFKDDKIRVISNDSTVTLFENHNICFENAKGKYVLFCHSDDELYPIALQTLHNVIEKRNFPTRYIVWGHSLFRDYYRCLVNSNQRINEMFSGEQALKTFLYGGLTPSGTCYSKDFILSIGGFQKFERKATPGDWSIMIHAAIEGCEFEMIDRLIFKREYASTAVIGQSFYDHYKNNKEAWDNLFKIIDSNQQKRILNYLMQYGSFNTFASYKHYIPKRTCIKYYLKQLVKSPLSIHHIIRVIRIK